MDETKKKRNKLKQQTQSYAKKGREGNVMGERKRGRKKEIKEGRNRKIEIVMKCRKKKLTGDNEVDEADNENR